MTTTSFAITNDTPFPGSAVMMNRNYQYGTRQVPITDKPLSYNRHIIICDSYKKTAGGYYTQSKLVDWNTELNFSGRCTVPFNKALRKLQEERLGMDGALGASIAEAMGTLGMIAARAATMRKAYSHLKKGKFRGFLQTLSVNPLPKHKSWTRNASKEASSLWREYWFGWSPLVSDIGWAVDRLQNPFPVFSVHATSQCDIHETFFQGTLDESLTAYTLDGKLVARVGCDAQVSNPNLYLANQMGFVNPAAIAWELVPFSFIVDWFTPVGDFLNSYSAYFGLSITNGYKTVFIKGNEVCTYQWFSPSDSFSAKNRCVYVGRTPSLPSFVLTADLPNFGLTRAATSLALLRSVFIK